MNSKKTVKLAADWEVVGNGLEKVAVTLQAVVPSILSQKAVLELHTLMEKHLGEYEQAIEDEVNRAQPRFESVK